MKDEWFHSLVTIPNRNKPIGINVCVLPVYCLLAFFTQVFTFIPIVMSLFPQYLELTIGFWFFRWLWAASYLLSPSLPILFLLWYLLGTVAPWSGTTLISWNPYTPSDSSFRFFNCTHFCYTSSMYSDHDSRDCPIQIHLLEQSRLLLTKPWYRVCRLGLGKLPPMGQIWSIVIFVNQVSWNTITPIHLGIV